MEIIYSKQAIKYLKKIEKEKRLQFKKDIESLATDNPNGHIMKLKGYKKSKRFVLNDYRVIFIKDKENQVISIEKILPRGDAYNSGY